MSTENQLTPLLSENSATIIASQAAVIDQMRKFVTLVLEATTPQTQYYGIWLHSEAQNALLALSSPDPQTKGK